MAEAIYGFIKKESTLDEKDAIYDKVLKAGEGWMHELLPGQSFRIVDPVSYTHLTLPTNRLV